MILKNGGYYDDNNNRWDADIYTEAQAENFSKTLTNCSDCSGCRYCSDCSGCSDCSDCSSCSDCSDCSDFKENPNRYTGKKIGSRNAQTTTYWLGETVQVVCGCFKGDLAAFEAAVEKNHNGTDHGKQYRQYIETIKTIMRMEAEETA